jgi:hypothetical protein
MALERYGYIVKSAGLNLFKNNSQIATDDFNMMVCGVPDTEHAIYAAQEMLTKNVQLIELCGAFSAEDVQQIRDAVKDLIPVGYVQYSDEERARIKQALS